MSHRKTSADLPLLLRMTLLLTVCLSSVFLMGCDSGEKMQPAPQDQVEKGREVRQKQKDDR